MTDRRKSTGGFSSCRAKIHNTIAEPFLSSVKLVRREELTNKRAGVICSRLPPTLRMRPPRNVEEDPTFSESPFQKMLDRFQNMPNAVYFHKRATKSMVTEMDVNEKPWSYQLVGAELQYVCT